MSSFNPIAALFRRRHRDDPVSSPMVKLLFAGVGLVLLYVTGVTAGYCWVHYVLRNESVRWVDVAALRWKEVRRGMAAQQFAVANREWQAKNYQAAYLAFASGLRNDPDNAAGRLTVVRFLMEMGSVPLAVKALEEGYGRSPEHTGMRDRLFEVLFTTGRDRRALELVRRRLGERPPETEAAVLRIHQVQATLNAEGAKAARLLLDQYADLEKTEAAWPVVAQVRWETQDRLQAIGLLAKFNQARPGDVTAIAKLTEWYLAAAMTTEALAVAEAARARAPSELAPRLLLIEVEAARTFKGKEWTRSIESYLVDFKDRPDAVGQLALLAGRKGWIDLSRQLYALGVMRQSDLRLLAIAYCDALLINSKFREASEILGQIEAQVSDGPAGFLQQVRQRQVLTAAKLGDSNSVREFSRRLVASLRSDPQQLETTRRFFERRGLTEALAEFSVRSGAASLAARP